MRGAKRGDAADSAAVYATVDQGPYGGRPRTAIAAARREEILTAAAQCFSRDGFHATSISKISAAAGMSAGHIYHFFPNKEAIVVGIVERWVLEWDHLLEHFESDDICAEFVERIYAALDKRTRPEFVSIWHEVLAETAHNPTVSTYVREIDRVTRERVMELIAAVREARGVETSTPLDVIADLSLALFEGLSNRVILNPEMDKELLKPVLVAATFTIIEG
jgi:TetR/AcrR family transcriptional regulator, repressor for uid operon